MAKFSKYTIYATWDDAMKVVRKAKKNGFTAVTVEPYDNTNPLVKIESRGKRTRKVVLEPGRWAFSTEFDSRVYVPEKTEYVKEEIGKTLQVLNPHQNGGTGFLPNVLVFRNYSDRTVSDPTFELYQVTLEREY